MFPWEYTEVHRIRRPNSRFRRGSTLLLYTDGAVERRGERLDDGLARLKQVSETARGPLEQFLDSVVRGVLPDGAEDDTALLGVRWQE